MTGSTDDPSAKDPASRRAEADQRRIERLKRLDPDELIQQLFAQREQLESQNEALRAAEVRLKESSKRYSELYDYAPAAYFTLSMRGAIRQANLKAATVLGVDRLFLIGRLFSDYILPEDRPAFERYRQGVLSDRHGGQIDLRLIRKDGETFTAQVSSDAWRRDNGQDSIRLVVADISERKLVEREILKAKEKAESASQVKSQFLANMSHEIRTPLGSMIGFADLALSSPPAECSAEVRESLKKIYRNGQHLLSLINDILDLSKVEAEELTVEHVPVDLKAMLDELRATLEPGAKEKGLALVIDWDADAPRMIVSDPTRLRQVILNLVGNAIKFTAAGRVSVRLAMAPPDGDQPRRLSLEVGDTGCGIPMERQAALFKPFSQADPSMTRRFGGTGLGLYLARRLAEAMGGSVALVSTEVGKGSLFRLTLDPGEPGAAAAPGFPAAPTSRKLADLKGRNVLVVEDAPDVRTLVATVLRRAGATVRCAENGQEAVSMALSDGFDLVLMDIQMPVLDGYQATAQLRQGGYGRPIMALTAHALAEERAKAGASGFDGYICKPVDFRALTREIAELTAARH